MIINYINKYLFIVIIIKILKLKIELKWKLLMLFSILSNF